MNDEYITIEDIKNNYSLILNFLSELSTKDVELLRECELEKCIKSVIKSLEH